MVVNNNSTFPETNIRQTKDGIGLSGKLAENQFRIPMESDIHLLKNSHLREVIFNNCFIYHHIKNLQYNSMTVIYKTLLFLSFKNVFSYLHYVFLSHTQSYKRVVCCRPISLLTFSFWTQWKTKINSPCKLFNTVNIYAIMTDSSFRYRRPNVHVSPRRNTSTMAPLNQALQT